MMKKMRSVYNKEDYDYMKGVVDPAKFHITFYYFLKAFSVLDTQPQRKCKLFIFYIWINTIFTVGLTVLATCHGVATLDMLYIAEAITYAIILVYKLMILSCTQLNLPEFCTLTRIIRQDFHYVCNEGNKYRKRFFETQLETWKICVMCVAFMIFVPCAMVIFAMCLISFYLATHSPGDGSSRPMLFPLWMFDIDFTQTPVYEVAFFFTSYTILLYAYVYIFILQSGIIWVRQITSKADLVIYNLQDLMDGIHPTNNATERANFENILKKRLREVVIQHHSMYSLLEAFAGVYKKLLMYEQKLCGPLVCLTAYGAFEKMAEGEFHAILILMCITAMSVCFVPSYLCTFLGIKVRSICDACFDIPIWNTLPVVRPYLVLIMQRSLRPLPLQAPGFQDISLQTFSSTMASAYSMFNMLRHTNLARG